MFTSDTAGSSPALGAMKFSRLSRRGLLLGLSVPQVACLAVGLLVAVAGLYSAGAAGLVWTSPVWCTTVAAVWVPVGGRKLIDWIPVTAHWAARFAAGQTVYRRRIVKPRPAGTLALPGDAAALRHYEDSESGAVMVHDPHAQTLTVVLEVEHPSFLLLDPHAQQRRVAGWGRVLATCCRSNRIARLQVLERTIADSGTGLAEWWQRHGIADNSWVTRTYRELINRAGPAGERHVTTVSIALDMRAAARATRAAGGGVGGAAGVLRQDMATLATALRAADLRPVGWWTPAQLAEVLRSAYDPAVAPALERHR